MLKHIKRISVIGDGGWGTTLAIQFAQKNFDVTLWGAFDDYVKELNKKRVNRKFLPGIPIPRKILITSDLNLAVTQSDLIVLAVPSQFAHAAVKRLKKFDLSKKILLSVIKGVDIKSLKRMSEIIYEELGNIQLAVLSGPTIAREVARGIPTTAVIACTNAQVAKLLQDAVNSKTFRIYTNNDITGVELGGSIKNVIAIACGVCDGLGFGTNTKAAILSRGLAEMTRLAQVMGAKTKTLFGLSGLGDLTTTCFSPNSRNRTVGEALGKGQKISAVTKKMDMVAEGVPTAKAIYRLSQKYKVSMPITKEVYNILYKDKRPAKAVTDLMNRKAKPE